MSYKTILVQVDDSPNADARVEAAAAIAVAEHAHLIGVAMTGTLAFLLYDPLVLNPADPGIAPYLDMLRQKGMRALEQFEILAQRSGVRSYEKRLIETETARDISFQARCADLVVLGQPDPAESPPPALSDFPEYVVMSSGGPGLIMPIAAAAAPGTSARVGERVLIAWNASIEAARAVHYAIPLLQRARLVEVAVFNPDELPEDVIGVPPGADLEVYLARHGVHADVISRATDESIGKALLELAANIGSDLLVMGCYGHSRVREVLLGGATRAILRSATLPVLMAH
jgi:nucleotide-binding universal stress UspA family protein